MLTQMKECSNQSMEEEGKPTNDKSRHYDSQCCRRSMIFKADWSKFFWKYLISSHFSFSLQLYKPMSCP